MGKAEDKFVIEAKKIKSRLEKMPNSKDSIALIDMLINRVTNEDFSNVVEIIEDFNSIDAILDNDVFSYTEKCKLTKKIIDSNFKILTNANIINLSSEKLRNIFGKHGYNNVTDISEVIKSLDNENIDEVSKSLISELERAILQSGENTKNMQIKSLYEELEKFTNNPSRSDKDYEKASCILEKLGVCGVLEKKTKLIEYYLGYYLSIDKKKHQAKSKTSIAPIKAPKKPSPAISRMKTKKRLLEYCDLLTDKQFDYENYDEVLSLLSTLELADNVNAKYFNYCFQNRITNASYYKLLLTKIKNNKKYEDEISLINWYLESIKSEEDKNAALESIYEILKTIPELEMLNFDYEYETMKRVRSKHE